LSNLLRRTKIRRFICEATFWETGVTCVAHERSVRRALLAAPTGKRPRCPSTKD